MKRIRMILATATVALIMILTAGFILLPSVFGFFLIKSADYEIVNEHNEIIPAHVFVKNRTSDNKVTYELIVYFPSEANYKYLTIVPSHKLIGLADQTDQNIVVFFNERLAYLYPDGSRFMVLNGTIDNLIDNFYFSEKQIKFNTFEDFRKFGKQIIVNNKKAIN